MMTVDELLEYLAERNPMHETKLVTNLSSVPGMKGDLGGFLNLYSPYMDAHGITAQRLANAYLTMVDQMTCARLDFARTGKYPAESQRTAVADVYANTGVMTEYMLGLALSQFLWKHHYQLFTFYREQVRLLGSVQKALEVGSGHGLFLIEFLRAHPSIPSVDVVDISETSLRLTKSLLRTIQPGAADAVRMVQSDIADFSPATSYDFITMGEVLEHVPDPGTLLSALKRLLSPHGKMFMSTCANCPTIDHIYHFETVDDIRALIRAEGLTIDREIVAPSEDVSDEDLTRRRLDILYGAILSADAT